MRRIACALLLALGLAGAQAQPVVLNQLSSFHSLPDGIEIESGPGTVRIVALRRDIVRVEMSPTHTLPENASWAVLPDPLHASVDVTPEQDASSVGFDTGALRVRIRRDDLAMSVLDNKGETIVSTAWPAEFRKDDRSGDLGFRVWMHMPEDEHYFGLGDKPAALDRRGGAFTMWNTDAYRFQEGTDPLYKSIPFFLTDRAGMSYGLFLDNTWRSEFDFGKALRNVYSFGAEGGPLVYYLMYGPAPKQVEEDYAWLTGTTSLPPLWSLGFQQSRYSYGTEQELRGIADRLRHDRIPSDVLYMDIDYQIKNRPFTVDPEKFPDFPAFVQQLIRDEFHLIMITDLHIAYLPHDDYAPFNSGEAGDHFLHNPNGSLYVGDVWPGPAVFPDFTEQSTRQWWGTLYKTFYVDDGASGFWNDMNEPSVFNTPTKTVPLDVVGRIEEPGFAPQTVTQRQIHNIMGMQNARATYDGLLALKPNQRPFVLTRATFAGGQRYGATWTGDNSSSWSHLRISTPMLESLGLCGYYMVGDDLGGYAGSPSMDLLTKWLEVGAFNPIMRDHTEKGSNPQEPWVGGPADEAVRRHYIEERYRLLPYLYTTAEYASRTGIPIMRPLFLEFPDATPDRHPLDLDAGNEFMFGSDLLVAPAPYPDEVQDYAVLFPPVPWYDYWTGDRVTHHEENLPLAKTSAQGAKAQAGTTTSASPLETVTVSREIDRLPVYVRGGSVIPTEPLVQDTDQIPNGPLELRVYPGPDCRGSLYQDDGTSFDYRKGDYLRVEYTCSVAGGHLQLHIGAQSGTMKAWWKDVQVVVCDWPSATATATLNGSAISGLQYDAQHRILRLRIPQSTGASDLMIASAAR